MLNTLSAGEAIVGGSCPWYIIQGGSQSSGGMGICVGLAGDINGDGVLDLFASEPGFHGPAGPASGRVRIRSGGKGPILWQWYGTSEEATLGSSIAGGGDLDGDGRDDVVIGAWIENGPGGFWSGKAYAFSGATGEILWELAGEKPFDRLGASVALLPRSGNRRCNALIGAPGPNGPFGGENGDPGHAYLVDGSSGRVIRALLGDQQDDRFGQSVASAGDINGDGSDDVLVGAPRPNRAHLFSSADGKLIQTLKGHDYWEQFGTSVAGLGDVDGDGISDVAVGAKYGTIDLTGMVYVYSGKDRTLLWSAAGVRPYEYSGSAVGNAGDFNADGVPDVIIGAYASLGALGGLQGRAYVRSGRDGSLIATWEGNQAGSWFGRSVSGLGDLNHDGYDDIIVGAPEQDSSVGMNVGQQFVFLGGPTGDINCDHHVNIIDLTVIISNWGVCTSPLMPCNGDVDFNGVINVDDLLSVINHWSR